MSTSRPRPAPPRIGHCGVFAAQSEDVDEPGRYLAVQPLPSVLTNLRGDKPAKLSHQAHVA